MRQEILDRPGYRGGRTPLDLGLRAGKTPTKLSSNELPYPPLPEVLDAVYAAVADLNRYPEPSNAPLLDAISEKYALHPDQIAVSNGTATIIDALLRLTASADSQVVYPWRTFEAVVPLMSLSSAIGVSVPLVSHHHDLGAMLAAISPATSFVYVCNPNNPSGTIENSADLREFMRAVPATTMIVLDEAYIQFSVGLDTLDGLKELQNFPNLVVLRTFSKAFGLAGLRAGFAAGSTGIAQELRKVIAPFSVTKVAAEATITSLRPELQQIFDERILEIVGERARLTDGIAALGVTVVPDSGANFIFLPIAENAQAIAEMFEERALIVRPYADGIRITVGLPEQNDEVLKAVEALRDLKAFGGEVS